MTRYRILAVCLISAGLSFFSIGCPYDGPHYPTTYGMPTATPTPAPLTASVTISGSTYAPAAVTIYRGGTVVWVNADPWPHSIFPSNGAGVCAADNAIAASSSITLAFPSAMTIDYHCSIHAGFCNASCAATCTGPMTGTVVVQ